MKYQKKEKLWKKSGLNSTLQQFPLRELSLFTKTEDWFLGLFEHSIGCFTSFSKIKEVAWDYGVGIVETMYAWHWWSINDVLVLKLFDFSQCFWKCFTITYCKRILILCSKYFLGERSSFHRSFFSCSLKNFY